MITEVIEENTSWISISSPLDQRRRGILMIELMLLVLCDPMPDSYKRDPNDSPILSVSYIDNEENCFVVAIQDYKNFLEKKSE